MICPRRLLIVGNSVSLPPREGVSAYPELLEAQLGRQWAVYRIIRSGKTIDEFESEVVTGLNEIEPQALVLQVGINECAPRPLRRSERDRLERLRLRLLKSLIIRCIHQFRPQIIRFRGLNQLTELAVFAECVKGIVAICASLRCPVIILPIMSVTSATEARQPMINREIGRYAEMLKSLNSRSVFYLEQRKLFGDRGPNDFCITQESVHLNSWAHEQIASHVANWLGLLAPKSTPGVQGETA